MLVPSYLLLALGTCGATDIWLFHTRAHHLHDHLPARSELVTHALRGPTYALLFALVPNFTFTGSFLVALFALLAFDLLISIADFWLEPASRSALGGLPRGEYLLHVVMAMLFGALVASVVYEGLAGLHEPTALQWQTAGVAPWLRALLGGMALGVLWSGITDLLAVLRLARRAA